MAALELQKKFAKLTIQLAKSLLKGTSFENSKLVGVLYRAITKFGYGAVRNTVRFHGLTLHIDPKDQSMAPGLLNETYEQDEIQFYKKTIQSDWIVFDVGANIGIYSLLGSALVGPNGKVFAFEPSKEALNLLNNNLAENKNQNVEVVPAAVSEQKGSINISIDENNLGSSSVHATSTNTYVVDAISLDGFIKERNIQPNFIKIDIEGAELSALKGAQSVKNALIMLEYNPLLLRKLGLNSDELLDYIFKHFKSVSKITNGGALKPIRSSKELSSVSLVNLICR